jgi:hypothetical protein
MNFLCNFQIKYVKILKFTLILVLLEVWLNIMMERSEGKLFDNIIIYLMLSEVK